MKRITLDKCDGLKNVKKSGTNEHPTIYPGMCVVVSQSAIEIKVEVGPKHIGQEKTNFSGKVLNEIKDTNPPIDIGDEILFSTENICYITQK